MGGEDKYRTTSLVFADCSSCVFSPAGVVDQKDSLVMEYGMLDYTGGATDGNGIGISNPASPVYLTMEQEVVNSLQHLSLTKEEETVISISDHSRADVLEEYSLSLFGRLLTDRQQNTRALKSTLRAA
nr:hypothetical protein CFP56_23232 [Quercus suber]